MIRFERKLEEEHHQDELKKVLREVSIKEAELMKNLGEFYRNTDKKLKKHVVSVFSNIYSKDKIRKTFGINCSAKWLTKSKKLDKRTIGKIEKSKNLGRAISEEEIIDFYRSGRITRELPNQSRIIGDEIVPIPCGDDI